MNSRIIRNAIFTCIVFNSCITHQDVEPLHEYPIQESEVVFTSPFLYFDDEPSVLFQEIKNDSVFLTRMTIRQERKEVIDQAKKTDRFVNWADFPKMTFLHNGNWISHVLEKVPGSPYAYHVKLLSNGFPPKLLHTDTSATEHGFVSYAPSLNSSAAVWLDGNATGGSVEHNSEHHSEVGAMQLRGRIFTEFWGQDFLLDDRVCDCCQTSLIINDHGDYIVFYRDRSETEVRDISRIIFDSESKSEPLTIGDDEWEIHGCPVNGPSAASNGESVLVAWFTGAGEKSSVKYAISENLGYDFGNESILYDQAVGRCQVLAVENGFLIFWMQWTDDNEANIMASYILDGNEEIRTTLTTVSGARKTGFPQALISNESLFVAFVDDSTNGIHVQEFDANKLISR